MAAVLVAGCGDDTGGGAAADPVGYLPADAGLVAVVDVDSDAAPEVAGRPLKELVADAAGAPSWDVIEVLVGEELVVGTPGPLGGSSFVAAITLDDEPSMRGALDRAGYGKRAEERGADVFEGGGPPLAIEDGTLVVADGLSTLARALLVRDGPAGGRFSRGRIDRAVAGLPAGAPVSAFVGPGDRVRSAGVVARGEGSEVVVDAEAAVAPPARRVVADAGVTLRALGATVVSRPDVAEWRAAGVVLGPLAERLVGLDPGPDVAAEGRVEARRRDRLRGTARVRLP